ncbi:NERD domain-containing protein (plasmid) [Citricoccus nitrophenolicus]
MSALPRYDAYQDTPRTLTGTRGTAGGQLAGETGSGNAAGWSSNRNAALMGAAGERRTANLLDEYASRALVLHDLKIPLKGVHANVDHAVVSGNRILLVDSKVWASGTYWSFRGRHMMNTKVIENPLGRSMVLARDGWAALAARHGGTLVEPATVVWPARSGSAVSVSRLDSPAGSVVAGTDLRGVVEKFLTGPAEYTLATAAISQLAHSGK